MDVQNFIDTGDMGNGKKPAGVTSSPEVMAKIEEIYKNGGKLLVDAVKE